MGLRLVLLLVSCGCSSSVAVSVPRVEVPDSALFEDAKVGLPNVFSVPVRNVGTATAEVSAEVTLPFEVEIDLLVIEPGEEAPLAVLVTPERYEEITGKLTVTALDTSSEVSLVLVPDPDGDGDGDAAIEAGGTDCDDTDPLRSGLAGEICNGIDDDCDGTTDNPEPPLLSYPDLDGDEFGDPLGQPHEGCDIPSDYVSDDTDCDDTSAAIFPGADETWYDNIDQACDGGDDYDQDGDTYSSAVYGGVDCDDYDAAVHPGVEEIWYDSVDQDCDGNDDDQDLDGDLAHGIPADCDDLDPTKGPSAPELDDDIDQDCDALIDEGLFSRGSLLLTEILADPDETADYNGRYIELYNPTTGHIELSLVSLVVGGFSFPMPDRYVDPGATFVMCVDQDPLSNGGVTCDSSLQWIGNVEEIEIQADTDAGSIDLDEVNWDSWSNPTAGRSWELSASQLDVDLNDLESSWCLGDTIYGDGDEGSPGEVLTQCQ